MIPPGYIWSIRPQDDDWIWTIADREIPRVLVQGRAPSRAIAAAMVVRAIAKGMTADLRNERSLAA